MLKYKLKVLKAIFAML